MKKDTDKETDWRSLERIREDIDGLDGEIISLLSKRQELAAVIGKLKRKLGNEITDPAREQKVLRRLVSRGNKELTTQAIRCIFSEIISAARSVQQELTAAYLGPDATFSHQAAVYLYGKSASFRPAESIEEVFALVEKGVCQQGVVPIENSYEGSVNTTQDLFYKYDLKIGAEIFLRIRHHLLSKAGDIKKVSRLYSHPMPVAQCRSWIKRHLPDIPITEVASTSVAAKMAASEPDAAAVGGRFCALTYGLNVLEENIEDRPDNVTRFLAIGKNQSEPTGRDKTSLLFFLSHKPGALYRALEALAKRNVNMTRIESRPMKIKNWEYLFFVDLEGHEQDENLREAIREMEGRCAFMKRLGSFPAGDEPWD